MSEFKLHIGDALSWRIGYGPSNFLLAAGSGFSLPVGRALYGCLKTANRLPRKHSQPCNRRTLKRRRPRASYHARSRYS